MFTDLEEIINELIRHFDKFNIDFFIVGAKARDILARQSGLKESPRKTSDVDFIKQANKAHNNKFDYSKVKYVNHKTKIKIKTKQIWQQINTKTTITEFMQNSSKKLGTKYAQTILGQFLKSCLSL